MSNEAWFAFSQKGGEQRFQYGWGSAANAEEYARHLDACHCVDDETRQYICTPVSEDERADLGLDTRPGDTINLADTLRDVLDDLDEAA
jgi:hypothetical protein